MCNAWNHPPNCTCGWGGDGHSGHPSAGARTLLASPTPYVLRFGSYPGLALSNYAGYCTPNANCPVCDQPVFFYQSPEGGRVFFDELGPPWPKHPCTDQSGSRSTTSTTSSNAARTEPKSTGSYQWEVDEWEPLVDVKISKTSSPRVCAISGFARNGRVASYVPHDHLSGAAPWLVRRRQSGQYQFSTLIISRTRKVDLIGIQLNGFTKLIEAANYAKKHRFGTGALRVVSSGMSGPTPIKEERKESTQNRAFDPFDQTKRETKTIPVPTEDGIVQVARRLLKFFHQRYLALRKHLPLAKSVLQQLKARHPDLEPRMIEEALNIHIHSKPYRQALNTAQQAHDLDGNRAGKIALRTVTRHLS